jgi:hypothetical protein
MLPVVSGSNPFKDEVAKIAREWFDAIRYEAASAVSTLLSQFGNA